MAETSQFQLPLIASSQAQKSITVNEALSVLDAVAQLRLTSSSLSAPPASPLDGEAFFVREAATGDWYGQEGDIAIGANGGWRFVTPKAGWNAFNVETGTSQIFDGTDWQDAALAATSSGTATGYEIIEVDHEISPGQTSVTVPIIPSKAVVAGVTGRVVQDVEGTLSGWSLGVSDDPIRYSQNAGLSLNSTVIGVSGAPTAYYSDTPLHLTAESGEFTSGTVRLAVHFMTLRPPRSV